MSLKNDQALDNSRDKSDVKEKAKYATVMEEISKAYANAINDSKDWASTIMNFGKLRKSLKDKTNIPEV